MSEDQTKNGVPVPANPAVADVPVPNYNNWNKANGIKFDENLKTKFLELYAKNGRIKHCAKAVGVSHGTVHNHIKSDPLFAEAFNEAKLEYQDKVVAAVQAHAIDGILEPIIGGQFKDEIVAYKRVYDTRLLLAEAKRVNPEYRDGQQNINVNVMNGVLVVPPKMSVDEWEKNATTESSVEASDG